MRIGAIMDAVCCRTLRAEGFSDAAKAGFGVVGDTFQLGIVEEAHHFVGIDDGDEDTAVPLIRHSDITWQEQA